VGLFDILRGKREIKQPATDRLFAMSTAYESMTAGMGLTSSGETAIVFQPLATADFEGIVTDMEDLVVGLNAVSTEIQGGGYGDRLLAAVFSFRDDKNRKIYWSYNFKRGAFYPVVPSGGAQQRDNERELRLKAQIGADLPTEAELERWFPLWGAPL
jgi:hypothetical protein